MVIILNGPLFTYVVFLSEIIIEWEEKKWKLVKNSNKIRWANKCNRNTVCKLKTDKYQSRI